MNWSHINNSVDKFLAYTHEGHAARYIAWNNEWLYEIFSNIIF